MGWPGWKRDQSINQQTDMRVHRNVTLSIIRKDSITLITVQIVLVKMLRKDSPDSSGENVEKIANEHIMFPLSPSLAYSKYLTPPTLPHPLLLKKGLFHLFLPPALFSPHLLMFWFRI